MLTLTASGRVAIRRVTAVTAYASYNAGFAYDEYGDLLIYESSGVLPATVTYGDGLPRTAYGALCTYPNGTVAGYRGGLPVTALGEVVTDPSTALASGPTMYPLTTGGKLAIGTQTTLARTALSTLLGADGNTKANYQLGIGLTGTTNCSAWANQIGTAGSLAQATGVNQPIIQADKSLLFDGATSFMDVAYTRNQPFTTYYVMNVASNLISADYFSDGKNINSAYARVASATAIACGTAGAGLSTGTFAIGTPLIVATVFNGVSGALYVNGTTVTGDVGNATSAGLTIGRPGGGTDSNYYHGSISEIIDRSAADSAATRAQIIVLLGAIHGIAL